MTKKDFINKHGFADCDNAIMKAELNDLIKDEMEKSHNAHLEYYDYTFDEWYEKIYLPNN